MQGDHVCLSIFLLQLASVRLSVKVDRNVMPFGAIPRSYHVIICNWQQREGGRSNSSEIPAPTVTIKIQQQPQ